MQNFATIRAQLGEVELTFLKILTEAERERNGWLRCRVRGWLTVQLRGAVAKNLPSMAARHLWSGAVWFAC